MLYYGDVGGAVCFVIALSLIPISNASAILQATPLAVTLGAALFLLSEMLQKPFQTQLTYRITGPWDEPVIERLSAQGAPAPAEQLPARLTDGRADAWWRAELARLERFAPQPPDASSDEEL